MTPSRPAPSNRVNQSAASVRSSVVGVRWTPADARPEASRQEAAPIGERALPEVLVVEGQEVPGNVPGRRLRRQEPNARRSRVNPEEERVEVEPPGAGDHDLAVDHGPIGEGGAKRPLELREVAVQRPQVAALQQELVAGAEDECPEAVPLGLVRPAGAVGQRRLGPGQHRLEWGGEREAHARIMRDDALRLPAASQAGS